MLCIVDPRGLLLFFFGLSDSLSTDSADSLAQCISRMAASSRAEANSAFGDHRQSLSQDYAAFSSRPHKAIAANHALDPHTNALNQRPQHLASYTSLTMDCDSYAQQPGSSKGLIKGHQIHLSQTLPPNAFNQGWQSCVPSSRDLCESGAYQGISTDSAPTSSSKPDKALAHTFSPKAPSLTKRFNHQIEAVACLKEWLYLHAGNPYPSHVEKDRLAGITGLTSQQVTYWFNNARKRSVHQHQPGILYVT